MTVTLSDLLTAQSEDDVIDLLIAEAQSRGLATTDWEEGSPELTLTEMFGGVLADLVASLMPTIIGGGFISTATGGWLTLNASERYNLTRTAAVATIGTERLTCAAGSGPYTIAVGQLRFAYTSNPTLIFTNTTGGVLAAGPSTLDVTIQAETPDADYNVAASTITTLLTPLTGVTCSNPALAITAAVLTTGDTSQGSVTPSVPGAVAAQTWYVKITQTGQVGVARFALRQGTAGYAADQITAAAVVNVDGSGLTLAFANHATVNPSFILGDVWTFTSPGTWYTTVGADVETDASLAARCRARWPDLGDVPTEDVYEAWAKEASPSVYYARATASPSTAATVALTVAGNGATIPVGTVADIQAYVDARAPLTDIVTVVSATGAAITITGATITVSLALATLAAAQAEVQGHLETYVRGIGIGDGATVYVRYAQLIEEIMSATGVIDCTGLLLNGAAVNVLVASNTIKTWAGIIATACTWVSVS